MYEHIKAWGASDLSVESSRCGHQGEVYGFKLRAIEFLWGRVFDPGVVVVEGAWGEVGWILAVSFVGRVQVILFDKKTKLWQILICP